MVSCAPVGNRHRAAVCLGDLTNREIENQCRSSESAVKSVVQQLFVRAGVRTRSQLVRMALEGSLGAARELAKRAWNAPPATPAGSPGARGASRASSFANPAIARIIF